MTYFHLYLVVYYLTQYIYSCTNRRALYSWSLDFVASLNIICIWILYCQNQDITTINKEQRGEKKSKDDFSSIILIQRLLKSITEENILCIFWFLWGERVREKFIFKVYDHLIIWAIFLKVFFFSLSFPLLQKYWGEDSLHTKTEQMSKKKKLEIKWRKKLFFLNIKKEFFFLY